MLYDIRLTIAHQYQTPIGQSRHLIRVLPRTGDHNQRVMARLIEIDPKPTERSEYVDFFGNGVTSIAHFFRHPDMEIRMSCRLEILQAPAFFDVSSGGGALAAELEHLTDLSPTSPMHFLGPSPRLTANSEIAAFARAAVDPMVSSATQVIQLGRAIYDAITFDAEATTVETDPVDAFRLKRGVCQDMSHIMILGLRALGIPAGYVSGYLRTLPPESGVRLEGADARVVRVGARVDRI